MEKLITTLTHIGMDVLCQPDRKNTNAGQQIERQEISTEIASWIKD